MTAGAKMAEVAALVGDPARANMLAALMDGRAMHASDLAAAAGVAPATASGHLGRLVAGRLLACTPHGRHRAYRLASAEVARLIETLMVYADDQAPGPQPASPRIANDLRSARTCYDHLAGRLGVALADALQERGLVRMGEEAGEVTDAGRRFLGELGVELEPPLGARRIYCRPCLDWSERRAHIAGHVGAAMLKRALELEWIARRSGTRAVTITPRGRGALAERLDIRL